MIEHIYYQTHTNKNFHGFEDFFVWNMEMIITNIHTITFGY